LFLASLPAGERRCCWPSTSIARTGGDAAHLTWMNHAEVVLAGAVPRRSRRALVRRRRDPAEPGPSVSPARKAPITLRG